MRYWCQSNLFSSPKNLQRKIYWQHIQDATQFFLIPFLYIYWVVQAVIKLQCNVMKYTSALRQLTMQIHIYYYVHTFNVQVITFGVCTTLSLVLRLWSFIGVLCAIPKSTGARTLWSCMGDGENAINARIITCREKNQPPTHFICNLFILWFGAMRYVWFWMSVFFFTRIICIQKKYQNKNDIFFTLNFCNS